MDVIGQAPGSDRDLDLSLDELREQIHTLTEINRGARDPSVERRLVWLRHVTGIRLLDDGPGAPQFATPGFERLPAPGTLLELDAGDMTPGVLRAGILRGGCVLARGLVPREQALRFATMVDRAYEERERHDAGQTAAEGYYEEFRPHPGFGEQVVRGWIKQGGGLLAADSPMLCFEMIEMFQRAGVPQLASSYLGEPALISVHKTTLRKADPSVTGAWHQDGSFMGPVRSLNLWLSLSRCGDVAPGLDIVPRRLDYLVTAGTEDTVLDYQVSQQRAEVAAGGAPIMRPIFEPGDALFFDELFLHQTGSDPSMPKPRFAIENWFFGGSAFPGEYAPIAV